MTLVVVAVIVHGPKVTQHLLTLSLDPNPSPDPDPDPSPSPSPDHSEQVKQYVITLRLAALCSPAEGAAEGAPKPVADAAAAIARSKAAAAAASGAAAAGVVPQARAAGRTRRLAMPGSRPGAPLAEMATPQAR